MIRHVRMGADEHTEVPAGTWRRVFEFTEPHRLKIALFLLTTVAASTVTLVQPLVLRELIRLLEASSVDRATTGAVPPGSFARLDRLALVVIGIALASTGLGLAGRWVSAWIGEGVIYDLRTSLFDKVQRMPIAFFTRTQTGSLISRLNNDVVGAQGALTNTIGGIVSNVVMVVIALVIMMRLSWQLTLLTLCALPLFIVPSRSVGKRLQKATREQMNLNASMNATMTERFGVSGALLVKLFGDPGTEHQGFAERAGRVRDIGVRLAMLFRTFFLALGLVTALATALVYWLGGRFALAGAMDLGTIVAFAAYVAQLYQPLTMLTNARVDLMTAGVSFDRVFEIMDLPTPIADAPDAVELRDPRGHVRFEGVWFRYPTPEEVPIGSLESKPGTVTAPATEAWVLEDVSFEITPGKMVALVGPSGAGKSTIVSLVPRLHDATRGRVTFDGHDVRGLTLHSLARAIGVVTQDAHLFHESLRDNLMYARPDATEAEMVEACKAARIHDLIASLPDGYDTVVGERGYRLSGGEKQRVAIARVLLKDPALVILDEATAHLDSTSESLIQRALGEALSGRSSLVIAHRLSTIVQADEILVIERGRIVERGPHLDLVGAQGPYSVLYRTQFASAGA
ncbi:MAG TPA: ABC transporter ATP-binding protein [Actinomycetota bacterium]|nr:ABC transporter ATP-binding protein [Actinomycetota bacterium]